MELCTDEESLPSLVSEAQDGVQEVRFVVKSRSTFSGCTITSCAQVVTDSGGNSSRWRSQEQFFGGREKDEHIGWGACCISEHKDWKSIKEKEQAGREENMGI